MRWFCAFLALRAGVFANSISLFFLAAAAFGDSFCYVNLIGDDFICIYDYIVNELFKKWTIAYY